MHALGTAWAHSNEISTLQHTHVVVVLEVEVEVELRVGLVLGSGWFKVESGGLSWVGV